jgi:hypothetical protein
MNHELIGETRPSSKFDLLKIRPEIPISPVPVLVAPGFGCSAKSYISLMEQLGKSGFITISPDYKYGKILPLNTDAAKQKAIFTAIQAEGYSSQPYGPKKVNIVAHSKGAYDAALVALKHPENFWNIIMVAPGGLRPKRHFWQILNAVKTLKAGERKDDEDKERLKQEGGHIAELIEENDKFADEYRKNKFRHDLEGLTSAIKSMEKFLPKLREKGIKIIIISQKEDSFYPPESYSSFVKDNVDEFIELPGIHGEIKYKPDQGEGQYVSSLLKKLEKLS